MKTLVTSFILGFVFLKGVVVSGDDGKSSGKAAVKVPEVPVKKSPQVASSTITPENEAEALAFVGEHYPELAKVLEVLKPMDPVEFRKAIVELLQVSRSLGEMKTRNPKRYEVALDAWKAKSRVELIAAQLAGSPSEELRSQLRSAIETKVDAEIRRQRFELEQAEAAAKKARETLGRLESNREAIVEARFRALTPKKPVKARKPAVSRPVVTPSSNASTSKPPAHPTGEDRR